jgi:glucose-1-phosphate cytidylyltransferase
VKVVILAGGYGTRLSEETAVRPKPMVKIGEQPILWHIMKYYSAHGMNDFVICCGYKGGMIKEYFANYALHASDVTFDLERNDIEFHRRGSEPWRVTLVDTGLETMTGGRLKRVEEFLDGETFAFTYGDGLSDVDLLDLVAFHQKQGVRATLTAVQPPGRFGALVLESGHPLVTKFQEKPEAGDGGDDEWIKGAWINGGFFVLEPETIDYIDGDTTVFERAPLERLAAERQIAAYRHDGFWQPMDTLRDKMVLEKLWASGQAPWAIW